MDVKMQQLKVTGNGFYQMCRLCLSVDMNKTDIFLFYSEFEKEIADIIMECVPVHISRHDKMPTYICGLCFTQLKTFHQFQIQAVQSDKTLQHYLLQLTDCLPQIKIELDHEELSDNSENQNSNADATSKCGHFEIGDQFDFSQSEQNVQENTFDEEISFKSKIKDEPMDGKLLFPTECADTVQTLSECSGSNDLMIASGDTEVGVETPGNFEGVTEKIFVKSEETYEYMPFKEDDSSLCPENFKDVECPRFNEDHLNGTEHPSKRQMFAEKPHDFQIVLKKSATSTESKSHQCDICQTCFSKSSNLKRHKLIHTGEKPHQCDICKMCFGTAYTLKKHNLIHTGEKPYQCDICQMCFRHTTSLKNHKLEHTGEKPYQCEICKIGFINSSILRRHHLIHTGEKPYQCDICKMCFIESSKLKRHNLIHTGEKPYQCEICKMCFRLAASLKSHKLKHTGEKPYQCGICKMCFRQAAQLKRHKLKHTG